MDQHNIIKSSSEERPVCSYSQRWNSGRASYRPLREPINTDVFEIAPITESIAKAFVCRHHYSRSYPAAVARYGLFEKIGFLSRRLVGVAVFSVPIQPKAAASYGAPGIPYLDLGRFVLLDEVGGNAETFFLARARRLLAAEKLDEAHRPLFKLLLAYSDPVPRTDIHGRVQHVGHVGGIYAASSAHYVGRAKPRTLWLADDGRVVSERSLSKLRSDDRGAAAAYEQLRMLGAPCRRVLETGRDYVIRALREGPFRSLRHAGNHIFAFTDGSHVQKRNLRAQLRAGGRYPCKVG